jgi:cytochrome bd ubiquinol oxidase subunit II
MIEELITTGHWLPYTFATLMGFAVFIYGILDGYDLGVGILTFKASDKNRDLMIASIGPFWDANETWLVLGVGILLVAFPAAHGFILSHLYVPVFLMLIGLIFRGVAFDFRAKVPLERKSFWNQAFFWGSFLTAFAQGYMLGDYILGFKEGFFSVVFCIFSGIGLIFGYCLIGSCWLIMKTTGDLQKWSIEKTKVALVGGAWAVLFISLSTPLASKHIFDKWFSLPTFFYLAPIPLLTGVTFIFMYAILNKMPFKKDRYCWGPFACSVFIFFLSFIGLAYSFLPYIVPEKITIVEAASAPESLKIILWGTVGVLPFLIGYTVFAYRIFHGKAETLKYD